MDTNDRKLWEQAEAQVGFKRHAVTYLFVNIFLWGVWYFSSSNYSTGFPWPAFASLGWGIGLVSHYLKVYVFRENDAIQREYDQLKRKQK
ncbi:hypothetical protein C9994_10530 [Marivirga lumbricoides]|uniref:2TM domain-containing protein n=1 Tax=Marivirga lumbricoides TaxID=1046115 RepID=A0A2T4DPJ4_9BACT|nr:hypothetical protein C9994_10530 [Marivirga lumbricoides]